MLTLAIPVYNMKTYLPRCMDTMLAQTCRDFEIVLVDDGSTDGSGAMCDTYAAEHPDFIRVIHKPNGGLSSARNAGIDAARGEFIVFPDPDDWVEPDYVEKLLSLQKAYRADLVCTGYYVDTDHASTPGKADSGETVMDAEAACRALILPPRLNGFAWNKLFRLDIIRDHQLRFLDDVGTTEDLDFAYRYLRCCERIVSDPQSRTYHYYQREGAATRSAFSPRKLQSLRTYEKIIADCATTDPELAQAARDEICTTAVNLIWMYENSECRESKHRKTLLRCIRENLPGYLKCGQYGMGRRIQTILAAVSPRVYVCLKNKMHGTR